MVQQPRLPRLPGFHRLVRPLGGNTVKMHLIGGAVLSALLAFAPAYAAAAVDSVPAATPASSGATAAPAATPATEPVTAPTPATGPARLNAVDLEAWLDGYMPYALEK